MHLCRQGGVCLSLLLRSACFRGRKLVVVAGVISVVFPLLPLQVVFEGVRGNGPYGDIAIDDVAFTNSKCSGGYIEMVSVWCACILVSTVCIVYRACMSDV